MVWRLFPRWRPKLAEHKTGNYSARASTVPAVFTSYRAKYEREVGGGEQVLRCLGVKLGIGRETGNNINKINLMKKLKFKVPQIRL